MSSGALTTKAWLAAKAALSSRVLIAFGTSTAVTGAVAGPMAYQAERAQEKLEAASTNEPTDGTQGSDSGGDSKAGGKPGNKPGGRGSTTTTPGTTSSTSTTSIVLNGPDISTPTTSTTLPPSASGLYATTDPDRRTVYPLDQGLEVYRRVMIFFEAPNTASVKLWIGDPSGSGPPTAVLSAAPFQYVQDFALLPPGRTTILAEVTDTSGNVTRRDATIRVGRG